MPSLSNLHLKTACIFVLECENIVKDYTMDEQRIIIIILCKKGKQFSRSKSLFKGMIFLVRMVCNEAMEIVLTMCSRQTEI
jgi:hypothetical protein